MEQILKRLGQFSGFAATSGIAILTALGDALAKADKAGYERGYADGARESREELAAVKKQLYAIAGALIPEGERKPISTILGTAGNTSPPPADENSAVRAPRGSVAPAVLDALRSTQRGMTPREVANVAQIPENSARGSLNKLSRDGVVEKRGSLWFLVSPRKEPEPKGEPSPFDPRIRIIRPEPVGN